MMRYDSLSNRLQRTERVISNPSYHPYLRPRTRSQSKSLNPSTPSSTTLNSSGGNITESTSGTYANTGSGLSSGPRFSRPKPLNLRRASTLTISSLSSNTSSSSGAAVDPRVQRIRRSDSYCGEVPIIDATSGKRQTLKRAPSFGASSLQSKTKKDKERKELGVGRASPDLSSDEEEKVRSRSAKKPRVGSLNKIVAPPSPSPVVKSPRVKERTPKAKPTSTPKTAKPAPPSDAKPKSSSKTPSTAKATPVSPRRSTRNTPTPTPVDTQPKPRQRANLQRNPSIFGAPLPQPPSAQESRIPAPSPMQISSPAQKTLRRTKPRPTGFGLARKISFGGLLPAEEGSGAPCSPRLAGGLELGSAFQMN